MYNVVTLTLLLFCQSFTFYKFVTMAFFLSINTSSLYKENNSFVLGCAIELRTNHRAESQMVVNNATRISKRMYPIFDREKFILCRLPYNDPGATGNDYLVTGEWTHLSSHD